MSILVVGSMAFDDIETPFGKAERIVGGAGTYIAYATSYFGVETRQVAVVGGDFPKEVLADYEKRNIKIEGVQIKEDEKSFFWSGRYHTNMNSRDTLVTELNVLEHFDPIIPDSYQGADYVMLGNLTPTVQRQVIERLNDRPKLIAMDTMNFWMDIMLDELLKTISMVDVLIINDEEARQLTEEYSLVRAARKILSMGPRFLVIKKGEHGALLFEGDKVFFAPALPLEEVFDPTGAGDTFAGGFMGYIARTDDTSFDNMKRAVIYGSAMASFCVEKFGTERLVNLTAKEVRDRVFKFEQLISVDLKLSEA